MTFKKYNLPDSPPYEGGVREGFKLTSPNLSFARRGKIHSNAQVLNYSKSIVSIAHFSQKVKQHPDLFLPSPFHLLKIFHIPANHQLFPIPFFSKNQN